MRNYLEYKKNKKVNTWHGECFVFDNRVSVDKYLNKGIHDQCYGCRHPITEEDKKLSSYIKGASCKYCIDKKTKKKLNSSLIRQKQIDLAEKRKNKHSFQKIFTLK